jgi:predicted ester cyclase
LVVSGGVVRTAAADTEANKALIRDRWLEMLYTSNFATADEIFTTDFTCHMPHYPQVADLAGYKVEVVSASTIIADFQIVLEDLLAEGDTVVGRFTATGKWPPEGIPYTNTWIIFFRFADGKIAEEWWQFDMLGVQEQLGVMPPTHQTYTWGEPSTVTGDPGGPDTNKAAFQRMIDEVFKGNLAVVDELFAPDYIKHDPASPLEVRGPEGFKQWLGTMSEPYFSQSQMTVQDIIGERDKVAVRWTWTGTHTGEFTSIAPTGNQVTVTGSCIHRFADGKFVESWSSYDVLGMMQQLMAPPTWPIEGAWISTTPIPDLGVIVGQWTVTAQDPAALTFTSVIRAAKPEATIFGSFPEADHESDHIGQTVWTDSLAFESTLIGYGTKTAAAPGEPPELVYISVLSSKARFLDRNNLTGEGTHAFYLGSQDADGDGWPDEGQEPVACFAYMSTSKRVQLMPACVPPPPEGE